MLHLSRAHSYLSATTGDPIVIDDPKDITLLVGKLLKMFLEATRVRGSVRWMQNRELHLTSKSGIQSVIFISPTAIASASVPSSWKEPAEQAEMTPHSFLMIIF